ncbi:hypothetical protein SNEBB_007803 [Seison nebaliae]|nr:hypothetical protein SNEBB_007803 [Seison nebaliae]
MSTNIIMGRRKSLKGKEFLSSSLGNKNVKFIGGVGPIMAEQLNNAGYFKATQLLSIFLLFESDVEYFTHWLSGLTESSIGRCRVVAIYMEEWTTTFVTNE